MAILGAGVSGYTAGIVLQLFGFRTRLLAEHHLTDEHPGDPRFASYFPAASIIPHTANIEHEMWHTATSVRIFEFLKSIPHSGLRTQRHYEVHESPVEVPAYVKQMPEAAAMPADGRGQCGAPMRSAKQPIFGWSFQCLFAEMPTYRQFLHHTYTSLGGEVCRTSLSRQSVRNLPETMLVNCTGAWSPGLFEDVIPSFLVRGHLIKAMASGLPVNRFTREMFSYNYTPTPDVYRTRQGKPADVYFYPRLDGWLLGGSRQAGNLNSENQWIGEETVGPVAKIGPVSVPDPILSLNREIVHSLTGVDPTSYPLQAMVGYRFRRDPIRLEEEIRDGRKIAHNYGHGGAGVTLSWSCAVVVAKYLLKNLRVNNDHRDAESWHAGLRACLASGIETAP